MRYLFIFFSFGLLFNFSAVAFSAEYWDLEIPTMDGAVNIESSKDPDTGIHTVSYEVSLISHIDPLQFYDSFFSENGWVHFMTDTYKQYPQQFETPPNENWSSFAARAENDKFILIFGTLWQNKNNNTNAQVTLKINELNGDEIKSHIDVVVSPEIDGSSLMELMQLAQKQPISLLRLANLVGSDPFQLEQIDINRIRELQSDDLLIIKYKEAMDSIINQYSDFASKYVPKN